MEEETNTRNCSECGLPCEVRTSRKSGRPFWACVMTGKIKKESELVFKTKVVAADGGTVKEFVGMKGEERYKCEFFQGWLYVIDSRDEI